MIDGWRSFGYAPADGQTDADLARGHTDLFRRAIAGEGFAPGNPRVIGTDKP